MKESELADSSFWIPRLRKWGFQPHYKDVVEGAADCMYPYNWVLKITCNRFFMLSIANILNSEMIDADKSLEIIRKRYQGIPSFILEYCPLGFKGDFIDIHWYVGLEKLEDTFLFLGSLSRPERLPLCITIDWALPMVEYLLKGKNDE